MKISIIHPSRSRPKMAMATMGRWLCNADNPVEYIFSLDLDDPMRKQYKNVHTRILSNSNTSAIAAINYAAHYATGDLLIVVSDDFDCLPHWDTLLLKALEGKEDFAVKTRDGIQDFIITLPICDRKYYERTGQIYPGVYRHLWSDSEWSCVAWMLGRYIKCDILFEHKHYSVGKNRKDSINRKNDSTWSSGKKLFYERKSINFGIPADEVTQPFPDFAGF